MLKELGIELDKLPDQFTQPKVSGRVLVYDADTLCYRLAAKYKRLDTAVRNFGLLVREQMFFTYAESAQVHLTHRDSLKAGRGYILGVKEYQANRQGRKPLPMLHEIRDGVPEAYQDELDFTVELHHRLEADDACMIDSYRLKDDGILVSEDKDLRQTPYPFYDLYKLEVVQAKGIGELWEHVTPAGNMSVHGIGRMFFWAQMLMGDTADNIQGLLHYGGTLIGPVRTLRLLEPFFNEESEDAVANFVIDAYREIDQNPIPEGFLLHMQRFHGDSFLKVLEELDWSADNLEFLNDCAANRKWFKTQEEVSAELESKHQQDEEEYFHCNN